ncbi:MAG: signal peptide peptidase SppA [Eubacterium sp.]|jgi:protease-4|nr:signal peptide peptidase SppA [Eubacterium sp.]MCH4047448.1 signal peptide peptidase SppA [Eubacterium sp.]MCI1308120.1 signal peptide peptidase SppA [Eubacterium sp.]MCI1406598.1 signal peptide peptidase SppA [Eubacterium sp.]MCI1429079.1 signal peptide peptidase SppA [Eubacterium sp.]
MKIGKNGKIEKETQDYFAEYVNQMDPSLRDNFVNLYITSELEKQRKRKNRKWIVLAMILIIALIVMAVMIFTGDLGHGVKTGENQVTLYGSDTLKQSSPYIGELHIEGEIAQSQSMTTSYDQTWLLARIKEMKNDSNNRGILLYVDTPGGSSYATDEMYTALKDYEKTTKRPIYAYIASEGASGGYYISCAAKRIIMNRDGWAGSIGVTSGTIYDLTGLMKKLGIKANTIHAGKNKTMGSYTQKLTSQQKRILQGLIDDAYNRFVGIVADSRGMTKEKARKIADGRVYTADQSKKLDLIDDIGTLEYAESQMKSTEKGLSQLPVLDIQEGQSSSFSLLDLLGLKSKISGSSSSGVTGTSSSSGASDSASSSSAASSSASGSSTTAQEMQLFQQLMQTNGQIEVMYLAPSRK